MLPLRLLRTRSTFIRYASSGFSRPSPPPLPPDEQREFEELLRNAQLPLSSQSIDRMKLHPDARESLELDFQGDINPVTGEKGGPKKEPVKKWSDEGDWSHAGRVTDF